MPVWDAGTGHGFHLDFTTLPVTIALAGPDRDSRRRQDRFNRLPAREGFVRVLVVGGAGYVGSHAVRECRRAGLTPTVFDNYLTGHPEAVGSVERISGDLLDPRSVRAAFQTHTFGAVLHFGTLSSVHESYQNPLAYYRNNVGGTLNLLHTMLDCGVQRLVLSSTAAVYGAPHEIPIPEHHDCEPISPYGRAALVVERLLEDIAPCHGLRHIALRFFNAAGADRDGGIGEDARHEQHLIPQVLRVALGRQEAVQIYGTDYDTPDGTCIRDFVHVSDVARAHVQALLKVDELAGEVFNLGTSEGYSVREVIDEARSLLDRTIAVEERARRPGDPPVLVASSEKARALLDWRPEHGDLPSILKSAWDWHRLHPRGYQSPHARDAKGGTARGARSGAQVSRENQPLFGALAVKLGYATEAGVEAALERQSHDESLGRPRKLIGMHMLEMGLLSTSQLIEILKHYEES